MLQKAFDRESALDIAVLTLQFGGSEAFSNWRFDLCLSIVCSLDTAHTLCIDAIYVQLPVCFRKVALLTVSLNLKIWCLMWVGA